MGNIVDGLIEKIENLIGHLFYLLEAALCLAIQWMQKLFNVFTGIDDVTYNDSPESLVNVFFNNTVIKKIYWGMAAIGLVLIFVFAIIAQVLRIIITGKYVEMNIGKYLLKVVLPVALVSVVSPVLPWLVVRNLDPGFGRLCLTVLVSVLAVGLAVLFIGLDTSERKNILKLLNGRKQV